jgi:hypothetical protein
VFSILFSFFEILIPDFEIADLSLIPDAAVGLFGGAYQGIIFLFAAYQSKNGALMSIPFGFFIFAADNSNV